MGQKDVARRREGAKLMISLRDLHSHLLPKMQNGMEDGGMNINTPCLKVADPGIESTEKSTALALRFVIRLLACCLVGVLSLASLLWLGILLMQLVHFMRSGF
jgi:hypothetical protein